MANNHIRTILNNTIRRQEGLCGLNPFQPAVLDQGEMISLGERIEKILEMNKRARNLKPGELYFMIFYDIENNKVRNRVAKFLLKRGCERIQKSVYMALLNRKVYLEMQEALEKIQALYNNYDSIIFLPVAADQVENMKLIGQNINVSVTFEQRSTLFF